MTETKTVNRCASYAWPIPAGDSVVCHDCGGEAIYALACGCGYDEADCYCLACFAVRAMTEINGKADNSEVKTFAREERFDETEQMRNEIRALLADRYPGSGERVVAMIDLLGELLVKHANATHKDLDLHRGRCIDQLNRAINYYDQFADQPRGTEAVQA